MTAAFQYRPRFVDIRVRPPKTEEEPEAAQAPGLAPGERVCDQPGCRVAGVSRAPKSRALLGEHYWFCQRHAAEYNRTWNFFAGMSEGEVRARLADDLVTGGRPGRFGPDRATARPPPAGGYSATPWEYSGRTRPRRTTSARRSPGGWVGSNGERWPTSTSMRPLTARPFASATSSSSSAVTPTPTAATGRRSTSSSA